MMIVALLLRPWICMIKTLRVITKVLADDVMIVAKGKRMLASFANALGATHTYMQDMGSRIAPSKSFNFASTAKARVWLRETWWTQVNTHIEVVEDFRYLGVHLSTTLTRRNRTIEARCATAMVQLRKLKYVQASAESKAKAIRVKVYACLFYGIEANDLTEKQLASISAAVIDVFQGRNDNHDTDWFYATCSEGKDLDPVNQVLVRRCLEFRRAVCKRPYLKKQYQCILQMYVKESMHEPMWYKKAHVAIGAHAFPEPVAHPAKRQKAGWKAAIREQGPIGLLVQAVLRSGALLDENY